MSSGTSGFRAHSPITLVISSLLISSPLVSVLSSAMESLPQFALFLPLPDNAPVTRTLAFGTAALTVLLGIQGRTSTSGLSYQDIFKKLHLWKLIASVFGFSSTPELAFGLYLLYYFRVFERQIGSNKYSVFVLFSVVVSSLLEVLALTFLKDPTLNVLASGPFGVIFSSFVPFYFDIPVSSRFRIFGIQFTDKSFIYLAGLQLLLSSWKRSLLPGVCGVIAGSLYRLNVFGIRRIKFPEPISSFFSRLTLPSLGGASHSSSTGNIVGSVPSYQGHQMEVNHPSAPNASMPEPQEDSVATLVSMGFDRPLFTLEMTSMWQLIFFSKHNPINSCWCLRKRIY